METNNKNLYDVLGVDKNATDDELKDAYREKIKEHHPDKNGKNEDAVAVIDAYTILKNPERRKHYDETGSTDNRAFDERFFAFVGKVLLKIIDDNDDVEHVDIVQKFKELVKNITEEAEKVKSQIDQQLAKVEEAHSRITTKNSENKVGNILLAHITEVRKQQARMAGEVQFIKDCAEILEAYGYRVDAPPPQTQRIWQPMSMQGFGG